MAQRRHHYERAFEEYLRARRIPYVSVDEARKALVPGGREWGGEVAAEGALKSFDFVIYGDGANLLVDVKGRKVADRVRHRARGGQVATEGEPGSLFRMRSRRPRLESWVTEEDVASLRQWQRLFGGEFEACFVFVYWCDEQPPDALFQEIFESRGRWYALRSVTLDAYATAMKPRSAKWRTVDVPTAAFERLSHPFASARPLAGHERCPVETGEWRPLDAGPDLPALQPYESPLGSPR